MFSLKNNLAFLLLLAGFSVRAQFAPAVYIDTLQAENVMQLGVADFNGDGSPDILSSGFHWPEERIRLHTQAGGSYTPQLIDSMDQLRSFDIADINNDGRMDFVLSYETPSTIKWYENTGAAFVPHVVDTALDFTDKLLLRDFDNNGMVDILSMQHVEIVLYLATAPGVFDTARVIFGTTEFYAMDAADYNNDGLLDVAVASGGFDVVLNNGGGNFTWHSQQGITLCFGLQSSDMDLDGDIDVAAYESLRGILYYANDGSGNFSMQDTILLSTDQFETFSITDLDCDADPDVYTTIPQPGKIVWVENDGHADFSAPHVVHTHNGQLFKASTAADMDLNGTPDLLWGNFYLGINMNQCVPFGLEEKETTTIRVYPNPVKELLHIDAGTAGIKSARLYDLSGRLLKEGIGGALNVAGLPTGMYFLLLETTGGKGVYKVVKD
jgi:hypothetical protein